MDGQTIELDRRSAEALRQQAVYERAMASIQRERRAQEAMGYAIMASVSTFESATDRTSWLGRAAHFAKLALIVFAGVLPNYLFWSLVLNG